MSCMGGLPADEAARCRLRLIDTEGTITQCISFLKRCRKAKMCLPMWQLYRRCESCSSQDQMDTPCNSLILGSGSLSARHRPVTAQHTGGQPCRLIRVPYYCGVIAFVFHL